MRPPMQIKARHRKLNVIAPDPNQVAVLKSGRGTSAPNSCCYPEKANAGALGSTQVETQKTSVGVADTKRGEAQGADMGRV